MFSENQQLISKFDLKKLEKGNSDSHLKQGKPIYQANQNDERIIFVKAFENFFVVCLENLHSGDKVLKFWGEKSSKEEHIELPGKKFHLLEPMRENLYSNPFMLMLANSALLDRSIEVIDLNTLTNKSKSVFKNSNSISHNTLQTENCRINIYEQNELIFKNKSLLAYFSQEKGFEFSLTDSFLLQNGFAVACVESNESAGVMDALGLLESRSPYPVSLFFKSGDHFLHFLQKCSSLMKIKTIIVHNLQFNQLLEKAIMEEKTTNVLPSGCSLLFLNRRGDASSLYTRKLLAKLREENFTNEFFYAEYQGEEPQNFGSIIINFLN